MGIGKLAFAAACALILAGCEAARMPVAEVAAPTRMVEVAPPAGEVPAARVVEQASVDPELALHYAARADGARMIEAVDVARLDPGLLRQRVPYVTDELPGTVVIETSESRLYMVEPGGTALRYGVAIGREGFGWTGEGVIARTARWPRWTPPAEMIARDPSLDQWADGMPGGTDNPLGARALYIYFGDSDSGYRIHGTNAPSSIGRAASSGCFRMLNQDAIDLYERVERGARVVVR